MTSLYLFGVILAIIAVVVWIALRTGRTAAQKDIAEKNAEIKDRQLEAALDKPDKSRLIDRLRNGKF